MKIIYFFLILIFSSYHFHSLQICTKPTYSQVAKDFGYPESPEIIQDENPKVSKSLYGRVLDPSGAGLEGVLVEQCDFGWKRRIHAVFTNSKGYFSCHNDLNREEFLRLSKPGFNTLLVKVIILKKSKKTLKLYLPISN